MNNDLGTTSIDPTPMDHDNAEPVPLGQLWTPTIRENSVLIFNQDYYLDMMEQRNTGEAQFTQQISPLTENELCSAEGEDAEEDLSDGASESSIFAVLMLLVSHTVLPSRGKKGVRDTGVSVTAPTYPWPSMAVCV